MSEPTRIRILIVDDSANLRQVTKRYLQMAQTPEYSFEFEEAENGEVAEMKLQEASLLDDPITVVFLDWMMPGMNGYDFMVKIRDTELYKYRPKIVMLTAETNSDQINACLKYGVSKYIIKPFTPEMIASVLQEILSDNSDGGIKYAV